MRVLLVSTWLVLGTVQTTAQNHAATKPPIDQATTTQTTADVANGTSSPNVVAKSLSPRDKTKPAVNEATMTQAAGVANETSSPNVVDKSLSPRDKTKPAVNEATMTQKTVGVANGAASPTVIAKPPRPRGSTAPEDGKYADSKETAGQEQLSLTPVATKLSFEIARLGKMNIEGLSRRALTWTVILVVLIAAAAGLSGRAAYKTSGRRVSTVAICVTAIVAGLAIFLVLRPRLAPLQDVETAFASVRYSVQNTAEAVSRQNRRIHELETSLQVANDRLGSLPRLEAALLIEKGRLQDREKQLNTMNGETQVLRNQLTASVVTISRQREDLYVMRHNDLALWLGWSALILAILATYHIFLMRHYRRGQYREVENIVEHCLRRRGI